MYTIVSKDIKIYNPSEDIKNFCRENLIVNNPDYIIAERLGKNTKWMQKDLKLYIAKPDCLILPFGTLKDIWKFIKLGDVIPRFHSFKGNKMQGGINLYEYQQNALYALVGASNGILQAPCGSGKTNIGLQLIKTIGGKALWLTHTSKLLKQSKERCEEYFQGDFGTITDGEVNIGRDITFATIQTMSKLDPSIYENEFDIVIVDECHHCVGCPTKVMQFYKVLSNCNARYKYGLSATLTRSDGLIKSLFAIIGRVEHIITRSDVGDKIIFAEHNPVMININYNINDYVDIDGTLVYNKFINMLSNNEQRDKIIIDYVKNEYERGRKQIVLCHRVSQVEKLANDIGAFCKASCLTGKVSEKNRLYDADVIVATYALAKEGLDVPELSVLHLATPQKNASTTEQAVGRIERNYKGKEIPICYDYVDENIPYAMLCFNRRRAILKKHKKS